MSRAIVSNVAIQCCCCNKAPSPDETAGVAPKEFLHIVLPHPSDIGGHFVEYWICQGSGCQAVHKSYLDKGWNGLSSMMTKFNLRYFTASTHRFTR